MKPGAPRQTLKASAGRSKVMILDVASGTDETRMEMLDHNKQPCLEESNTRFYRKYKTLFSGLDIHRSINDNINEERSQRFGMYSGGSGWKRSSTWTNNFSHSACVCVSLRLDMKARLGVSENDALACWGWTLPRNAAFIQVPPAVAFFPAGSNTSTGSVWASTTTRNRNHRGRFVQLAQPGSAPVKPLEIRAVLLSSSCRTTSFFSICSYFT